jgi:N-acetylneuraminate lyase
MELHGIVPAIITPVNDEGEFQAGPFAALIDYLYRAGADGIYVCGQTGEGLIQSVAQRKLVAEEAVRNSPAGKQVILHTGAYATSDAVELTRHASAIGVTAVSSLPPCGFYSFAEVERYYRKLAAASDVPFLVYFFPEICPGIQTTEQIETLLAIPGVAGLKFTDFDLCKMMRLRQSGAVVYNGRDEVLAAGLLMGAGGGIGSFYNIAPELFVEVYVHARAGRWDAAVQTQQRINELIRVTLKFPLIPAIKQILAWSGLACGPAIEPRRPLTEIEVEALRAELDAIDWRMATTAPANRFRPS